MHSWWLAFAGEPSHMDRSKQRKRNNRISHSQLQKKSVVSKWQMVTNIPKEESEQTPPASDEIPKTGKNLSHILNNFHTCCSPLSPVTGVLEWYDIKVRCFSSPSDRDPPQQKISKILPKFPKILNVYFWGDNVYFWEDNVFFWGFSKTLGFLTCYFFLLGWFGDSVGRGGGP